MSSLPVTVCVGEEEPHVWSYSPGDSCHICLRGGQMWAHGPVVNLALQLDPRHLPSCRGGEGETGVGVSLGRWCGGGVSPSALRLIHCWCPFKYGVSLKPFVWATKISLHAAKTCPATLCSSSKAEESSLQYLLLRFWQRFLVKALWFLFQIYLWMGNTPSKKNN